jgi:hypothetical protein
VVAHAHRHKLPKPWKNVHWLKHHAAYKITGLLLLAATIVLSYGGGQI